MCGYMYSEFQRTSLRGISTFYLLKKMKSMPWFVLCFFFLIFKLFFNFCLPWSQVFYFFRRYRCYLQMRKLLEAYLSLYRRCTSMLYLSICLFHTLELLSQRLFYLVFLLSKSSISNWICRSKISTKNVHLLGMLQS